MLYLANKAVSEAIDLKKRLLDLYYIYIFQSVLIQTEVLVKNGSVLFQNDCYYILIFQSVLIQTEVLIKSGSVLIKHGLALI